MLNQSPRLRGLRLPAILPAILGGANAFQAATTMTTVAVFVIGPSKENARSHRGGPPELETLGISATATAIAFAAKIVFRG